MVRAERRREIGLLKRTVEDLQAREDKVVGLYVDGKLDDVTYQRQRDLLLTEKHAALDRLAAASEELDDKYLVTADRIFELAKQARTLWIQRTPTERRQLLEMVLSNPRLDGVTVRYDMKKPFAILSEMTKGNDWRARRDSNRPPINAAPTASRTTGARSTRVARSRRLVAGRRHRPGGRRRPA